jgi:hypothetical protein
MPRVIRALNTWKNESLHRSVRTEANVLVLHGASQFIDPIHYFETWVVGGFPHEEKLPDGTPAVVSPKLDTQPETEESKLLQPKPHEVVPRMLRGISHGDLHGRNVLVGLVNNRALWPTVFDYEDMTVCGFPGWDFVKLETELKIRAWRDVLPRDERKYLQAIWEFERKLDEDTERYHHDGNWPIIEEPTSELDRLRALLLEIRRMASIHLGKNRGRPRQWLEEYYFLQAAYGINAGYYPNLERRELIAVYVSAGVAVSRLTWPIRRERNERRWLSVE